MATINQVLVNDVLYDIEVNAENVVGEVNKATVATKVGTDDKGSATQPIYLNAGVPTATKYKLEADVPSNAKFSDTTYTLGSFGITASAAELNYCDGVTSNIQTQLDGKQATITGAASTIANSNLTATRAVVSDADGKVTVATTTATELNRLSGVTDNVQSQLNGKQATITGAATSITGNNLTASRALVSNADGKVAASSITSTELGYLDNVSSNIQTQLNGKQPTITGAASTIANSNLTATRAVISDADGKVRSSDITVSELNCLDNVSGNIQTQLNRKPNVSMTLSGTTLYITST